MGAVVDGGRPIIVRNEDVIRMAGVDEVNSSRFATPNSQKSNGGASAIWVAASGWILLAEPSS